MSHEQIESGCRVNPAASEDGEICRQAQSLSAWNDEQLLLEYARSGKQQVFEEIVRRYQRKIRSYLCRYLGDEQLAEDALQTTFLQVHLKCRLFEPGRALSPWLYCIATHQATDLLRRNRRHKAVSLDVALRGGHRSEEPTLLLDILEDRSAPPAGRLESTEDRQRVWSAMERLPQGMKQLLVLVKCQGMKYQEAAELLGIPLGTVKSRMNEALRRLHRALIVPAPTATVLVRSR